ncbi:MAG TPA: TadE family protein [Pseudonocardiaceae bacterium]
MVGTGSLRHRLTARRTTGPPGDRGAVSVEAALALCAITVVLAMVVAGIAAVTAQLRCTDAAREAARLVSRGEPERVDEVVRRIAPDGAHVVVRIQGDTVQVEVTGEPVGGLLPGVRVAAHAYAVLEPGVRHGADNGVGSAEEPG